MPPPPSLSLSSTPLYASVAAAGAGERASPSMDFERMRRVLALPISDAVVYVSCGALWAFTAGMTLAILGGRAGGDTGARVAAAALSVVHVAIYPLLLVPLAVLLFSMRAAVSAVDSNSEEEPAPRPRDAAARRRDLWQAMMKDFKLVQYILFLTGLVGLWMENRTLWKGSFKEKAGTVLIVFSTVGIATISCFFVWPSWVVEWRTSQKGSKSFKH